MEVYGTSNKDVLQALNCKSPTDQDNKKSPYTHLFNTNEETCKRFEYLKDAFIKTCIKALTSKTVGGWIHLMELLNLIRPIYRLFLECEQTVHYLLRIYDYSKQDKELKHLNLSSFLCETFENFDFEVALTKSISTLNSQKSSEVCQIHSTFSKDVSYFDLKKQTYVKYSDEIFKIKPYDLQGRVYEPKQLNVIDLQKFLPRVVSEISRLESTWNNALGLTVTALNTDIPQEISVQNSPSPTFEASSSQLNGDQSVDRKNQSKDPSNGIEVIESLVKSGGHRNVQIWYLNVVPSIIYNPYNLIVASKSTIKKEHIVMSVFGVLHVRQNGISDLTALGQWYMEAVCFGAIRNIAFFKHFYLIKALKTWKEHFKYSRFLTVKKKISNCHLYNIPSVPNAVLKIKSLITQIDNITFLPDCTQGRINISKFEGLVSTQMQTSGKTFQRLFTLTMNILSKCHNDCINYSKYCRDQYDIDIQPHESLAVAQKRKEKQLKNKLIAEENLQRFATVLKLINIMLYSHISWVFGKKIEDFVSQELLGNINGSFQCIIDLSLSCINLSPSEEYIYNAIIKAVFQILDRLEKIHLISLQTVIKSFVMTKDEPKGGGVVDLETLKIILELNPSSENVIKEFDKKEERTLQETSNDTQTSIKDTILTQSVVQSTFSLLKTHLKVAFKEAEKIMTSHSWVNEILVFVESWNTSKLQENESKYFAAGVEKDISKLKKWKEDLKQIDDHHVTSNGLLYIDLSQFQNILIPKLDVIFLDIIKLLSEKNSMETRTFLLEINELTEQLSDHPSNVKAFVSYFVYVNNVHVKVPKLQEQVDHIKALYELIKNYHRQLTVQEDDKQENMWMTWEKFMFSLQNGTNFINAHLTSYSEQLDCDIKNLLAEAEDLVVISTSGEFLETSRDNSIILNKLKKHYEKFNMISEQLQHYAKYFEVITGYKEDIDGLITGQKKIHSRYELWKYLELSSQTINEWKHTVFSKFQANIKKVLEKVKSWKLASEALKREIPRSDLVFVRWMDVIKEFTDSLPVLQELSNPTLKTHHWKEIFVVLGQAYDVNTIYRVNDIVSMNILENAKKIQQISRAASSEHALQQYLHNLIKQWKKKDFKFKKEPSTDRRNKNSREGRLKLKNSYMLAGIEELVASVDDSLVTLQSMLVSPHVADVKELASQWNSYFQELKQILEIWMTAQQQWMYLSQIFSYGKMKSQHQVEYKIFSDQDMFFRELIEITMVDSKVLYVLEKKRGSEGWREYQGNHLRELLLLSIQKMSGAIKELKTYLSTVQDYFPRLFYWSDEELLSLLTGSYSPSALVPVVRKCFPDVVDVTFEIPSTNDKILTSIDLSLNLHLLEAVSVQSHLEETLFFKGPITSTLPIESWLETMEKNIRNSLKMDILNCRAELNKGYFHVLFDQTIHRKYTLQTLLLCFDMWWSTSLQGLHEQKSLEEMRNLISTQIKHMSKFIKETKLWSFENANDKRCIIFVQTILLKSIHYLDQLDVLASEGKDSLGWLQIVRYRHVEGHGDKEASIQVCCLVGNHDYGFEYHGPSESLVCTPFTDRCIFALLVALKQYQAGCLFGPTTTSKTELIYHMSKLLGRHCCTLNCTRETGIELMEKFVYGALRVGSIFCVDQVEKVPSEVLSIMGNLLECIYTGFHNIASSLQNLSTEDGDKSIDFNGRLVQVNPLFGCIITCDQTFMSWKTIPDNMRRNVHGVSVNHPDHCYIYEVWFRVYGYHHSVRLSKNLSSLVESFHDKTLFSLRRIKNVIVSTRRAIHTEKVEARDEVGFFAENLISTYRGCAGKDFVTQLLLHAETIFKLPKEVLSLNASYDVLLTEAVKEQILADNLSPRKEFVSKVLELHRLLSSNQSVVLYGACASGKTSCYKTLARTLCQFYSPWSEQGESMKCRDKKFTRVNLKVVYPNMMDTSQLFGHLRPSTQSWKDGLITKLLDVGYDSKNKTIQTTSDVKSNTLDRIQQWLVLDGEINVSWISVLEGVLDQPRTAILANGKQMVLHENIRLLFEVEDLSGCSPSFLSRSSLLFFQAKQTVDWQDEFKLWRKTASNKYLVSFERLSVIEEALSYTLKKCVKFITQDCDNLLTADLHNDVVQNGRQARKTTYIVECHHVLEILSSLLNYWIPRDQNAIILLDNMDEVFIARFLVNALAFSFGHALTALVHHRSFSKVDLFIRQLFSTCPPCSVIFPASVTDCYFDGHCGELKRWNEHKAQNRIPLPTSNYIITKEIQQAYMLGEILLSAQRNCLIIGDMASGKSSFVKFLLGKTFQLNRIQVSCNMSVAHLQDILLTKFHYHKQQKLHDAVALLKKRKESKGDRMLFFVDDLHISATSNEQTRTVEYKKPRQTAMFEYIRQLVAEGGCYANDGDYFHYLSSLQLLISYSPPSCDRLSLNRSSRQITRKLLRHLSIIQLPFLSERDLKNIFTRVCFTWLGNFEWLQWKQALSKAMVTSTVNIHFEACKLSQSTNPLLVFSLHDLSKVFKSLVLFKPRISASAISSLSITNVDGILKDDEKFVKKSVSEFLIHPRLSASEILDLLRGPMRSLLQVWCTELRFVYEEKISSEENRSHFHNILISEMNKNFGCFISTQGTVCEEDGSVQQLPKHLMSSLFTNPDELYHTSSIFCPSLNEKDDYMYTKHEIEEFRSMVLNALKELNHNHIFVQDHILEKISNLSKAMFLAGGHALLVSQAGHGRRRVARIVATLLKMQFFELPYGSEEKDCIQVIKDACNSSGLNGKPVIVFAAEQLPKSVYKCLNTLLSDGFCPDLYTTSELQMICSQLLPGGHLNVRKSGGSAHLKERFFQRIKNNLHIALCQSEHTLKKHLQQFPSSLHKMTCVDVYKNYTQCVWKQLGDQWFLRNETSDFSNRTSNRTTLDNTTIEITNLESSLNLFNTRKANLKNRLTSANKINGNKATISYLILDDETKKPNPNFDEGKVTPIESTNFESSPTSATKGVGGRSKELNNLDFEHLSNVLAQLHCLLCKANFEGGIYQHPSPLQFFECLEIFKGLYGRSRSHKQERLEYLQRAMSKVEIVQLAIKNASCNIERVVPLVKDAKKTADECEMAVKKVQAECAKMSEKLKICRTSIEQLRVPCEELKKKTKEDFQQLKGDYDEAVKLLDVIDYHAIDEMKSYDSPPSGVIAVGEMLCTLFAWPHQGWKDTKLLLMRDTILQDIQDFDRDHVSNAVYKKLSEFLRNPITSEVEVDRYSRAANEIRAWMTALHSYVTIFRTLKPTNDYLKSAENEILNAERELSLMDLRESGLKEELRHNNQIHRQKMSIVKELQKEIKENKEIIKSITNLLDIMKPFTDHWQEEIDNLLEDLRNLPEDCLLIAASIIYLGSYLQKDVDSIRERWLEETWLKETAKRTKISDILSSKEEQNQWARLINYEDARLIENLLSIRSVSEACMKCWPLLINAPIGVERYVQLIERMEQNDMEKFLVISGENEKLGEILLKALCEGVVLLIKNIERAGHNDLLQVVMHREKVNDVQLMVTKYHVDVNSSFRLYLSSSLPLAEIMKEKQSLPLKLLLGFDMSVTRSGLEYSFLRKIIASEAPELEAQHQRIHLDVHYLKNEKKAATQTVVLEKVLSLETSLFEDEEFVDYIGFCRENLWLAEERIHESQVFAETITRQREEYRPLAAFFATAYEILCNVSRVNNFYQFSLDALEEAMQIALEKSLVTRLAAANTQARVVEIKNLFITEVFQKSCKMFFQEHRFLFPLCLVLEELIGNSTITPELLKRFLSLPVYYTEEDSEVTHEKPDWLDGESWSNFVLLSKKSTKFDRLLDTLHCRAEEWKEYFRSRTTLLLTPYLLPELNQFEVALLWIAYNKRKISDVCQEMILCSLGPDFLKVPAFNFLPINSQPYRVQLVIIPDNNVPIVKDPSLYIKEVALDHGIPNVTTVPMGYSEDNQELNVALRGIRQAVTLGYWVILQNCHLVKNWSNEFLVELETMFDEYRNNNSAQHKDFRLWFILREDKLSEFSSRLLKRSEKIIWEPLKNYQQGLRLVYQSEFQRDAEVFDWFKTEIEKTELYATPIQLSEREYNTMKEVSKSLSRVAEGWSEQKKRIAKDVVFFPQLTDSIDENVYKNYKKKSANTQLDRAGGGMDCYFAMLYRYFRFKIQEQQLCDSQYIDALLDEIKSVKSLFIYEKHPILNRPFIFHAIRQESVIEEERVLMMERDLSLLERVLFGDCLSTERTTSIHRTISDGQIPEEWLFGESFHPCNITTQQENSHVIISLDLFINDLKIRFQHFNDVINTLTLSNVEFKLNFFKSPRTILNAVKLEISNSAIDSVLSSEWCLCSQDVSEIKIAKGIFEYRFKVCAKMSSLINSQNFVEFTDLVMIPVAELRSRNFVRLYRENTDGSRIFLLPVVVPDSKRAELDFQGCDLIVV